MGLFRNKSAVVVLMLVTITPCACGRNDNLELHQTPTGDSRWCNVVECGEGSEAVVCEPGRPETTRCVPCPHGFYMNRSTLSTQNKRCDIKRVCSENDGKRVWHENDNTRNRQCRCMNEYNYYSKDFDGTDPNYSATECYYCPAEKEYVHSTKACTLCHGYTTFDEYGNKHCNDNPPTSIAKQDDVTRKSHLEENSTTAPPDGRGEPFYRESTGGITTTQQPGHSHTESPRNLQIPGPAGPRRLLIIAIVLPTVISVALGIVVSLWCWKNPRRHDSQAEARSVKETEGLLEQKQQSESPVVPPPAIIVERVGLQNTAVSNASSVTDLDLRADDRPNDHSRQGAGTTEDTTGLEGNTPENVQNVRNNKCTVTRCMENKKPLVHVAVTINNNNNNHSPPPLKWHQDIHRMDTIEHGQGDEEFSVVERSDEHYPIQVQGTMPLPPAGTDVCPSTNQQAPTQPKEV